MSASHSTRRQAGVRLEKSWKTACRLAQTDHAFFHDLRRTTLTNMMEAGFTEKEVMEISGHKTGSVFDHHCIVSERWLKQLGERLETHLEFQESETLESDAGIRQKLRSQ